MTQHNRVMTTRKPHKRGEQKSSFKYKIKSSFIKALAKTDWQCPVCKKGYFVLRHITKNARILQCDWCEAELYICPI